MEKFEIADKVNSILERAIGRYTIGVVGEKEDLGEISKKLKTQTTVNINLQVSKKIRSRKDYESIRWMESQGYDDEVRKTVIDALHQIVEESFSSSNAVVFINFELLLKYGLNISDYLYDYAVDKRKGIVLILGKIEANKIYCYDRLMGSKQSFSYLFEVERK